MRGRTIGLLAVAASVVAAACGTAEAEEPPATDGPPGVRVVSVEEGRALHGEADRIVIDVRTPEEFADGHLARARNIDIHSPSFADEIGALDPAAAYLVYCRTSNRSAGARELMVELGFGDVADIEGGTVAWAAAGLPLER